MLLAIDIGNTNINAGLFNKKRLIKKDKIKTDDICRHCTFFKKFAAKNSIDKIIMCSVVPKILPCLNRCMRKYFGVRPLICGKDIKVPIKNLYKRPKAVGQDRLVNAFSGIRNYGKPLIVVDFGTAITFDVISKRAEYLGGIIVPGVDISFDSLFERTALLPMVKFKLPKSLIGKDTVNSIRSGVVYGYASLCDGIIDRLMKKLGRGIKVVATGGYSEFISRYSKSIHKVDKNLTLKGLRELA